MHKHTIFGPPGTGKTTHLMTLLDKVLMDTPAGEVAFCSFTRQGTNEGASRAKKKFKLNDLDLKFFRTIHSLCFREMGALRSEMVSKRHYKLFSKSTGISFAGFYSSDFTSVNDMYLHLVSMEKHNPALAASMFRQISAKKYEYIRYQYEALKAQLGLKDFDDLLLTYIASGEPLPVKVAFIDEAQDLTPLQWKVVEKLFCKADRIYIAGDDDQAVYEWSGADVEQFLSFSDSETVLTKSYRLPSSALYLATKISKDIRARKDKRFLANGRQGSLVGAGSIRGVKLNGGELVLARTNRILQKLSVDIAEKGLPYKLKGKISWDKAIVRAIQQHVRMEKGDLKPENMRPMKHMFKRIDPTSPWLDTIKLPAHEKAYYSSLINNIEKKPVLLETYHSSKGSENDHVIVSPDLSKKVYDSFTLRRDSELRCLYVAVTRTRHKLTILRPTDKYYYPTRYLK